MLTYEQLEQRIESAGLDARGGFHPAPDDTLGDVRTVILVGFTRNQHWAAFANSPERWARRALALHVSPLGVLIDPRFGLWHSYRGALALTTEVALPTPVPWSSPCESCKSKPCLHTCPVGAVQAGAFDVDSCRAHVRSVASSCRTVGCLARRACPIGAEYAHSRAQAQFYMRAFASRGD